MIDFGLDLPPRSSSDASSFEGTGLPCLHGHGDKSENNGFQLPNWLTMDFLPPMPVVTESTAPSLTSEQNRDAGSPPKPNDPSSSSSSVDLNHVELKQTGPESPSLSDHFDPSKNEIRSQGNEQEILESHLQRGLEVSTASKAEKDVPLGSLSDLIPSTDLPVEQELQKLLLKNQEHQDIDSLAPFADSNQKSTIEKSASQELIGQNVSTEIQEKAEEQKAEEQKAEEQKSDLGAPPKEIDSKELSFEPVIESFGNTNQVQSLLAIGYGVAARISANRPTYSFSIRHELPPGVQLLHTEPPAQVNDRQIIWHLGNLAAGEAFRLRVIVQPDADAVITPSDYSLFHATFSQFMQFQAPIVRPRLEVGVQAPIQVSIFEPFSLLVTATNQGNWKLEKAKLNVVLPEGIFHPQGSSLTLPLDSIHAEEMKRIQIPVKAIEAGKFTVRVAIVAEDYIRTEKACQFEVVKPVLGMHLDYLSSCLVGESFPCRLEIKNSGNDSTKPIKLSVRFPEELVPIDDMLRPEQCETESTHISCKSYSLTELKPGERHSLFLRFRSYQPGTHRLQFLAQSLTDHGINASCQTEAKVEAILTQKQSTKIIDSFMKEIDQLYGGVINQQENSQQTTLVNQKDSKFTNSLESEFSANKESEESDPAKGEQENRTESFVFGLGNQEWMVSMDRVIAASPLLPMTRLPLRNPLIRGVVNFRGELITVISLNRYLNSDTSNERDYKLLVIRHPKKMQTIGILVERFRGHRSIPTRCLMPVSEERFQTLSLERRKLISDICEWENQKIYNLNDVYLFEIVNKNLFLEEETMIATVSK